MKKFLLFVCLTCSFNVVQAANLLEVFQQAQSSDPIFQQAVSQRLSTKQGVPISVAGLLPNIFLTANPSVSRTGVAGSNFEKTSPTSSGFINPRNNTQRAYSLTLTVNQTIFDFAQFSTVAGQVALSKGADATLNAALQDLMVRVASAYFAILLDEDTVRFNEATKIAFAKQLDQNLQQYKVGLKTLTDVYTAQASYDTAVANYIAAQTTLANDKENLRVLTGIHYDHLASLSENFPLISPQPTHMETWVKTSLEQNWSIKASRYNTENARQIIKQQFAGHLPTIDFQGTLNRSYDFNINSGPVFNERPGPGTATSREAALLINVPIFSGGGAVAHTNRAVYDYQVAQQQTEQTMRDTLNSTRQSYQNIVAGISKVAADKQAIKSTISSLEGLKEGYRVGTQTLVDVLNQQQKVLEAQTNYATDRYAFVNNILLLKQAAGTLCYDDLRAINTWLIEHDEKIIQEQESALIQQDTTVGAPTPENHEQTKPLKKPKTRKKHQR